MVLGLDWSAVHKIELEEKKTLFEKGTFVHATITAEPYAVGTAGIRRVERRIVYCGMRYFLLRIVHCPLYVGTDEWRIYGKDPCSYVGDHDRHVRRISRTNDAREDEVGERVWVYDNTRFREPEVEWATDSLRQMTWAERLAIRAYEKMLKKMKGN